MRNLKCNIEFFKKLAIDKNGECISTEYIACDEKLKFKCNKGHIWETVAQNIKLKNKYCIDNSIQLIRIPYTIQNIEEFLNNNIIKI